MGSGEVEEAFFKAKATNWVQKSRRNLRKNSTHIFLCTLDWGFFLLNTYIVHTYI